MPATPKNSYTDCPEVVVVIPYYQEEQHLLHRTLSSVFNQNLSPQPMIIVVDDTSPVPAEGELSGFSKEQKSRVRIILQENAGPGAARNTGLGNLPANTKYVAFLDSDDEWLPEHLSRAVMALERGNDLFFSNYCDPGKNIGKFESYDVVQIEQHEPISGLPHLYVYQGDLRDAILTNCPIETSTVVFRHTVFSDLRFRPEFRNSAEDHMFWFEMAVRSPRVAFSEVIGTQFGIGVNIYRGVTPYSAAHLLSLVGSSRFRFMAKSKFPMTPAQIAVLNVRLNHNRRAVVSILMHRMRRRKIIPVHALWQYLKTDPWSFILIPWGLFRSSLTWIFNRPDPE